MMERSVGASSDAFGAHGNALVQRIDEELWASPPLGAALDGLTTLISEMAARRAGLARQDIAERGDEDGQGGGQSRTQAKAFEAQPREHGHRGRLFLPGLREGDALRVDEYGRRAAIDRDEDRRDRRALLDGDAKSVRETLRHGGRGDARVGLEGSLDARGVERKKYSFSWIRAEDSTSSRVIDALPEISYRVTRRIDGAKRTTAAAITRVAVTARAARNSAKPEWAYSMPYRSPPSSL